ncbi:MAG TPA: hypothetical protein PK095_01955 [Myxococcota bacterium]|nr:hypothetical protein [Myxococcota bacterium]
MIRPPRPTKKSARLVDELEQKIELKVRAARRRVLTTTEVDKLVSLEERLDNHTIAACEAAHAPRVEDDPNWENRIVDEYAESDNDYELDEYLELRRREFDCDRCPHAAFYSLYPQDPCELSVGPLLDALTDAELVGRLATPMGPDDMGELAARLDTTRLAGEFADVAGLDVADLLEKSSHYLRFWGLLGFGIRPELVDEEDTIVAPGGDGDDGGDEPPPGLLH